MAEGVLSFLLGEGEEAAEAELSPTAAVDPVAGAAALAAAGNNLAVSDKLGAYLEKQTRLVDIQTEHLHEQRAVQLSQLRLRRFTDRLKAGMQVFVVLVATLAGLILAVMVSDAFSARSVVVEPFETPPALATRGLSGKVVAGNLLDELTRLQAATRSNAAKRHLSNAWTGDIRIEVPETGMSLGELDRMLKARFGHEVHIEGDLVQTESGGLALAVRGDNLVPKVFTGGAKDLDSLMTQAAEYIYGQSAPALFEAYLLNAGRDADAVAFAKAAYATASAEDRPHLLIDWANSLGNLGAPPQATLPLYREALKQKPDYWAAYSNVMNTLWLLGDEEGAWRTGETMRKEAGGRPGRAPQIYCENWDALTWNLQAWGDEELADAVAHQGVGTGVSANSTGIADVDVRMHDTAAALFELQTGKANAKDPNVAAMDHFIRGRIATESGDGARAATEMEAFAAAYADPAVSTNYPGYLCWVALAEALDGHADKADAALKAGGHYVDCSRFRGDILDQRGDWAGAQKAYAEAVAIAPDLPAGYYSWGVALARHGDFARALENLAAANRRGPRWADPLKAWGDVLSRQGRWNDALGKYDEALKYAPAWIELRQARDAAARRA